MDRIIKKFVLAFFISFLAFQASPDNWTLGVMEFSFKQTQTRSESSTKAASVLPQLIIEQFSNDDVRTIPAQESLDRKLKELQTARLSLFLQLSKECKARDALVLTTLNPRALQKALKSEQEKIADIERQIDENLEEVKKVKDESAPKIAREKAISEGKQVEDEKKDDRFFPFQLPFPFFHRNEKNQIVTETVVLYKSDSTALFKPSDTALESGFSSWDFEQEVTSAKINGLITGEITTYGDYCAVTAHLRIYPGGQILGSVTEVGLLSDLMPLANDIARNLDSKIANALPVLIEFNLEPHDVVETAKITIDGIVFALKKTDGTIDNRIIKDSGIHHISIEAAGYEPLSFTYAFSDENRFFVRAELVPQVHGVASIRLKKYRDGVFHTYGLLQSPVTEEQPVAKIEVNSKSVLGVFRVPKAHEDDSDSSNIAFFRIPQDKAFDGVNLVVNAKPFDRAANIDKRRRWMYTAYTALICSLPFTFYTLGQFTSENYAYSQGRGNYDDLLAYQRRSNICTGITAACGVWFAVELVRYLWAADRVLPATAKIDKKVPNFDVPPSLEDQTALDEHEEEAPASADSEEIEPEREKTIETEEITVQ
ncbi:MAG: hypothetical protein IJ558_11125 [Treponema sp.]|nr:hypothetical protein [Treponema sp.]